MSKFNLKNYKKDNGDAHITMKLKDQHEAAPDVINQKQLQEYRVKEESQVTIQKMLEDKRLGEDDEVTEKRLDTHKAMFENKYRNSEAYEGDLNKLEEKRLKGDKMEDEKYESSSAAPKKMRWWEEVKSPDGLKVAKNLKKVVVARDEEDPFFSDDDDDTADTDDIAKELSFDKPRWDEAMGEEPPEEKDVVPELAPTKKPKAETDDFDITGDEPVSEEKLIDDLVPDAVEEDLPKTPSPIRQKPLNSPAAGEEIEGGDFTEMSFDQKDIDGTPMVFGRIITDRKITDENEGQTLADAIDFIQKGHPDIEIDVSSLDTSNISKGEIEFMVAAPMSAPSEGRSSQNEIDEAVGELEKGEAVDEAVEELEGGEEVISDEELQKRIQNFTEGTDEFEGLPSAADYDPDDPSTFKHKVNLSSARDADFEIREITSDTKKK